MPRSRSRSRSWMPRSPRRARSLRRGATLALAAAAFVAACTTARRRVGTTTVASGGDVERPARNPRDASERTVRILLASKQSSVRLTAAGGWRMFAPDGTTLVAVPNPGERWVLEPAGRLVSARREDLAHRAAARIADRRAAARTRRNDRIQRTALARRAAGQRGRRGSDRGEPPAHGRLPARRGAAGDRHEVAGRRSRGGGAGGDGAELRCDAAGRLAPRLRHDRDDPGSGLRRRGCRDAGGKRVGGRDARARAAVRRRRRECTVPRELRRQHGGAAGLVARRGRAVPAASERPDPRHESLLLRSGAELPLDAHVRRRGASRRGRALCASTAGWRRGHRCGDQRRRHRGHAAGRVGTLTVDTDRGRWSLRGNEIRTALRSPAGELLYSTYFSSTSSPAAAACSSCSSRAAATGTAWACARVARLAARARGRTSARSFAPTIPAPRLARSTDPQAAAAPLRIGVVGAGAIAQVAHLPVLSKMRGVELIALCDNDRPKARALADRFGSPTRTPTSRSARGRRPRGGGDRDAQPSPRAARAERDRGRNGRACERPLAMTARGAERILQRRRTERAQGAGGEQPPLPERRAGAVGVPPR